MNIPKKNMSNISITEKDKKRLKNAPEDYPKAGYRY